MILSGIIAGASQDHRQLLEDPSLSLAADLFRTILGQVVSHNLNAIENIAQANASCTVEPLQRSRNALDTARDRSFVCLYMFQSNLSATREYSDCLRQTASTARSVIDALKSAIDACLATLTMPIGINTSGASVATAVNVNVLVNAVVQQANGQLQQLPQQQFQG